MAYVSVFVGRIDFRDGTEKSRGNMGLAGGVLRPGDAPQAGYAAIDALVALVILSLGLVLGLEGLTQARKAADLASETRRAQLLITHLVQSGLRSFEVQEGQSDGFEWHLQTTPVGADRPIALCRRSVLLTSSSERSFETVTLETCPETPIT